MDAVTTRRDILVVAASFFTYNKSKMGSHISSVKMY